MTATSDSGALAAIGAATRSLHLPTVRSEAERISELAVRQRMSHLGYLADVLSAEVDERSDRRRSRRTKEAHFPRMKRLQDYDYSSGHVDEGQVAILAGGGYLERREPIVLLGDSGTGKSHLLIGLGVAACEQGRSVRYLTAAQLVNELAEAADERKLSRLVGRYGRVELLCLDELGYVQLDARGSELLFQILTEREEKASVITASNLPFSEWGRIIPDPRLVSAIVDRLTFNGHIIETGSDSYRLKSTKARRRT